MPFSPFEGNPYLIELLTPAQAAADLDAALERFKARYTRILASGSVVSVPDNPMGHLRFTALETLAFLDLPVKPEQLLVHLNSFHRRADLDELLAGYRDLGVRYLLCVSGDGSSRLPRLEPADLGRRSQAVTSVELLAYIREHYPCFRPGAAFNPWEPKAGELDKLRRKLAAGGEFLITQPLLAAGELFAPPPGCRAPFILGAWLSDKTDLLADCLGLAAGNLPAAYDARRNLVELEERYPGRALYLSLLSFKRDWQALLPRLKCAPGAMV